MLRGWKSVSRSGGGFAGDCAGAGDAGNVMLVTRAGVTAAAAAAPKPAIHARRLILRMQLPDAKQS